MNKTFTCLFILVFGLLLTERLAGQTSTNSIEVSPFTNLLIFSAEGNSLKGQVWGSELVYHINMADNQSDWVKLLNIRDVSVALSYRNMQNVSLTKQPGTDGFLGDYYGVIGRLGIVLVNGKNTRLMLNPGFGLGYATQTYYTNNNPLVGSHINFTAQIGLKAVTNLSQATRFVTGIDLYHFSNAAVKNPNDGVNTINASVGIEQNINQPAPKSTNHPFKHYEKGSVEFSFNIGRRGLVQTGGGINQFNIADQKNAKSQLYQSGFYLGYNYRLNPVLSLRAGTDAVYYYKTLDTISAAGHFYATYQELGSSYDRVRWGASVGTELWLGKVSFTANLGYYIHFHYFVPTNDHTYSPPNFYWTFGGRYYLNPWLALEAKQYLHRTQADFAGFGLIFKIR